MAENKTYKVGKNRVGQLKKSGKGTLYITVEQDMALSKGDSLFLKTPKQEIEGLVERGFITQDQAEERISKIPDFVKYVVDKAPAKQ